MRPTLQTERLTLRPLAFSDRDAMVDRIMSDPDVMAWLPGSDKVSTLEGQRDVASDYLAGFIESWDNLGFGAWAVCIGHAEGGSLGRFIGYCGFIPGQIEGAGPEIAYAIGKALWGQGIVTEALNAGLQWIFTETAIPRVYAVTDKGNTRSRRVS